MKKLLFYSLLCMSLSAGAQMKEGKVVYERTIQMQFRGAGGPPPEVANNMPRERKNKFELSFAKNESLWESIPDMEENNDQFGGGNGNRMFMRFGGDDLTYTNFETGRRVDQRELSTRSYIVEDSIQKLNWKLSGETKTLLGHTVQKAIAERYSTRFVMAMENGEMKRQQQADTTTVTAWFAQDIPVPAGPEFQGQLPGLILELTMNNGRVVYKALEISPKVNPASIKEPKGGKRITAAEFTKEREKEMQEMRRNMPRRMQVRIAN